MALHAAACLLRGATLVFPGRAVAVEHMSIFVPMAASTTLLVSAVAEVLQRYCLQPAALERFVRAVRAFREPGEAGLVDGATALPVEATGGGARRRLTRRMCGWAARRCAARC